MDLIQVINSLEGDFERASKDHLAVKFAQECLFAKQLIQGSSYLANVAQNNLESFKNAILNVASIGISLNPAERHAYLVPRDGRVCLDVSYMGLAHLAQETGSIRWVQAQLVHTKDEFNHNGSGEKPTHKFNSFGERGEIVGAYCIAKTSDGDYLTETMTIDEICQIRDRSVSYKSYKSKGSMTPWVTDFTEMAKKTVVKRAAKLWPKSERTVRLDTAIFEENQLNGIDFKEEQKDDTLQIDAVDYKLKGELIDKIKVALTEKTKNLNLQQKGVFLIEKIGIRSFKELNGFIPEKLEKILIDINQISSAVGEKKEGFTVEDMPF